MAKRVVVGVTLGILGCSAEPPSPSERGAAPQQIAPSEGLRDRVTARQLACAPYQQYTAALATFTVDCLGTITPDSFHISATGELSRTFNACPAGHSRLSDIDGLLSLQRRDEQLPLLRECWAGHYAEFLADFSASGVKECPTWRKLKTVNPVTHDVIDRTSVELQRALDRTSAAAFGAGAPVAAVRVPDALEEKNLYAVSFAEASTANASSAGATASACAAGFPGFVLEHDARSVLTDPYTWLAPWTYPNAAADPFLNPGFFHPMSFAGPPPGAQFGHYNRYAPCPGCPAERCSYYQAGIHRITHLQPECLDPSDISTCVSYCGPPL